MVPQARGPAPGRAPQPVGVRVPGRHAQVQQHLLLQPQPPYPYADQVSQRAGRGGVTHPRIM